jgi:peroxiredoxin family protein
MTGMKLYDAARAAMAAMAQAEETRAWFTTDEINAWAEKKLKENPQWTPDWNTEAVLVEEMQRMAKRIEELEALLEAKLKEKNT